MKKNFLSGNEAIARGAYEAGLKVASAYPGTPSTEILEALTTYEGVYSEWAPNEKVALEVAIGASFAGVRAMASMKHVGLNVAADPLFTAAYTGVVGGLVIITADDPEMHSSQNAQDNRNYALASKIPMLEPSDAEECRRFTRLAFDLSEKFDTPVLVRTTTRVSHVKGIVYEEEPVKRESPSEIQKMPEKFVMLPVNARRRRVVLEERLKKIREFAEGFEENRIFWSDKKIGIITAGISYLHVRDALPEASVLKLGMVYPLPERLIRDFASQVERLYIVEELDPFLELQIKAMGIECTGKEIIPAYGELDAYKIRSAITGEKRSFFESVEIPPRPPAMCPGCPHRGVFYSLSKLKVFVSGDIGCYTLGALKPLSAMDTCVCMGASVSNAHGIEKALGDKARGRVVAVIGDSTFIHSGITPLIDIVYNKGTSTIIILDNRTTAMTGHQENPVTGKTAMGEDTLEIDLAELCRAIGVKRVTVVNPHDIDEVKRVLKEELSVDEPSVIISKAPCALLPEERRRKKPLYRVVYEKCTGCRVCLGLGCPAISWKSISEEEAKARGREKQKGVSIISEVLCAGCGECEIVCKYDAIVEVKE
ncbi:MAG: indolepyruvate ferredoxin oxidoreductase subunit alpha [Nitrospirae bacterium]|nr:indolepyruvate ferredoxin oxidoreductase subunit alpha [Nitrospirota bacterium]